MNKTMVPDPDCYRCDGVGWYEGGKTLQTNCSCRRLADKTKAETKVLDGSLRNWKDFYNSLPTSY